MSIVLEEARILPIGCIGAFAALVLGFRVRQTGVFTELDGMSALGAAAPYTESRFQAQFYDGR